MFTYQIHRKTVYQVFVVSLSTILWFKHWCPVIRSINTDACFSISRKIPRIIRRHWVRLHLHIHVSLYNSLIHVSLYNSLIHVSLHNSLIHVSLYNSLIHVSLYNSLIHISLYNSLIHVSLYNSLIHVSLYDCSSALMVLFDWHQVSL